MLQHLTEPTSSEMEQSDDHLGGARLSQRAYQSIRTSLRLGELRPGEKLILRPLASKLRLSATPVREALLRLVSEQALGLDERSSVIVPTVGLDDLDEIRELRIDLEGRAAEVAAGKATADVIAELEAIAARFAAAATRDDRHEMTWQDDRFHREILLASHRTTLVKIVENLQVRTGPLIALCDGWRDDARGDTQVRLIEALRARDGAAARRAMTDGFEALFGQLRAAMEQTRTTAAA